MKKIMMAVIAAIGIALLTGCGMSAQQQTDTALLMGFHAGMMIPSPSDLSQYLEDTCGDGGTFFAIRLDGNPKKVSEKTFDPIRVIGKKKSVRDKYITEALQATTDCQAETDGLNVIAAIRIAAECLNNDNSDHAKRLVIYDTFLCDQEPLNLSKLDSLQELDIDSTVNALKEANQLPELDGVDVVCIAAPTAEPQEELSQTDKEMIEQLYSKIFQKCNAKSVTFTSAENSSDTPVPSALSIHPVQVTKDTDAVRIVLDANSVAFAEDSDVLLDETKARKSIQDAADKIIDWKGTIFVCGNTASGDEQKALQLSLKRAQVVTEILLQYGLEQSQIEMSIGFGFTGPYYQNDVDSEGNQIENLAQANRTVVLEPTTSSIGHDIKSGKWKYIS